MSLNGVCLGYGGPLATARWILADESRFHNGLTELRYHAQPISLYNHQSKKARGFSCKHLEWSQSRGCAVSLCLPAPTGATSSVEGRQNKDILLYSPTDVTLSINKG